MSGTLIGVGTGPGDPDLTGDGRAEHDHRVDVTTPNQVVDGVALLTGA